jgi:hypothetical protein
VADDKFSNILSASSLYWRSLSIDTRNHITASQAQFAENGIGLYETDIISAGVNNEMKFLLAADDSRNNH